MELPDFKITFKHRFSGEVSFIQKMEDTGDKLPAPWKQLWLLAVRALAIWLQGYKIKAVIQDIDEQAVVIKNRWEAEEVERIRGDIEARVKITDPGAVVTTLPPTSPVPGYLIEYTPDGSYAQSVLGGAMEITSGARLETK